MTTATLQGMGWILPHSMGYPGQIHDLTPSAQTLPQLRGKDLPAGPHKPFGRMDAFSKLGFTAIAFAMAHAGHTPIPSRKDPKQDIALVAATRTGCLDTDLRYLESMEKNGGQPSPAIFAYTLPSCFLGEAAIYFGLTGQGMVLEEGEPSGLSALDTALDLVKTPVVCGMADTRKGALFMVIAPGGKGPELQRKGRKFFLDGRPLDHLLDACPVPPAPTGFAG